MALGCRRSRCHRRSRRRWRWSWSRNRSTAASGREPSSSRRTRPRPCTRATWPRARRRRSSTRASRSSTPAPLQRPPRCRSCAPDRTRSTSGWTCPRARGGRSGPAITSALVMRSSRRSCPRRSPLVVDRTMTWDGSGYGAHAETATTEPSPRWYFAEGATHSGFALFYLLQNPGDATVTARVRYLRAGLPPLEKTYALAPRSRTNIWANLEEFPGLGQALASAEVSAVIETTGGEPIIAERAMYRSTTGRLFDAGHESMGVRAPSTRWFLAEGRTGPFFDEFILLANPTDVDAVRAHHVPARRRQDVRADVGGAGGRADEPLGGSRDDSGRGRRATGRCRAVGDRGVAQWRTAHGGARDVVAGRRLDMARSTCVGRCRRDRRRCGRWQRARLVATARRRRTC